MVAPHHFGFRFAAGYRMNEPDPAVQRQRSADNRHATGMTDIYGNGIGPLLGGILFPLDDEFHFGKDAFVAA
jgi:hypothetical protein